LLILDGVACALHPATAAAIVEYAATLGSEYTIIAIIPRPAWTDVADEL
jgi:hypothetical protein